jgi:hypothetical protein
LSRDESASAWQVHVDQDKVGVKVDRPNNRGGYFRSLTDNFVTVHRVKRASQALANQPLAVSNH